jgi:single-stranded-DNA-specific exonuclease
MKKWLVKDNPNPDEVQHLQDVLKVEELIAKLLVQRGIQTFDQAQSFFRPQLNDLIDPFLLKNMRHAVDRLSDAIAGNQKVLLFGDYDVDGTSAVALMWDILHPFLEKLDYYIPDRYTEGYGLSQKGVDFAVDQGVDLIITLDCGVRSVELIGYGRSKGVDFIVCDHHQPGDVLPDAIVLNPKQSDCPYPFKELSGCGVGWKLLSAYFKSKELSPDPLYRRLDLVAISIGADIVSVLGENRILAFHGMMQLNAQPAPAFRILLERAKRSFPVTLTDVVFSIAPRINAAGRIRSGRHAVQLMISKSEDEINELADAIEQDNEQRKTLDQQITAEAIEHIEASEQLKNGHSLVVYNENWHKGVVGIVASRLVEQYFKPTIVLTLSNGVITGSARTVNNFDIHEAISACGELLQQFGGHQHAAGLSLLPENLTKFQERFEQIVAEKLHPDDRTPEQQIDAKLSFDRLFHPNENRMHIPRFKRILDQFEPFGPGNMKPVFLAENVFSMENRLLKEAHLKMRVTQPNHDVALEAIGFNLAKKQDEVASGIPFQLAFTLENNSWKNKETLQLNVKDIRSI